MYTFDVYLKQRLTELDVIITQLVQRDSFSVYDLLYIICEMGDVELLKNLKIENTIIPDAKMDNLLEIVFEKIRNEAWIDADMALLDKVIAGGETEMVSFASELDIIEKMFTDVDSSLEISVDPVDYHIARTFGNVEFDMEMLVNELDTFKYSYEQIQSDLELLSDVDFSSIKKFGTDEFETLISIDPINIFYLITIGGRTNTYLYASPIEKYVLKKVLHDVETEMYLNASTDIDWQLIKYINIENSLYLLADMTIVLIKLVSGQSEMYLDCEASAGLKRYRLLEEMDDLTLSDFDSMTLEEVDYVILTE